MIKKTFFLLFLISFVSCSDVVKEYDNNGNIIKEYKLVDGKKEGVYKEYDNLGRLKLIHNYKSGKVIDSSLYYQDGSLRQIKFWNTLENGSYFEKIFNSEGKLESYGKRLENGIRVNKWPVLDSNGKKISETEYFNYNNEEYVNQIFHFKNKDTLFEKGNFYETLSIKDTLLVGEKLKLYFFLRKPALSFDSSLKMIIPKYSQGYNFNDDFSNIHDIKKDTVLSLNNYIEDKSPGINHITTTLMSFKSSGIKKLRIILNENIKYENRTDNLNQEERLIFFEKEIFVKDTVGNISR